MDCSAWNDNRNRVIVFVWDHCACGSDFLMMQAEVKALQNLSGNNQVDFDLFLAYMKVRRGAHFLVIALVT